MQRQAIRVRGTVQGVGLRPFVHTVATRLGLVGFVGNDPDGVIVEAQGPPAALAELVESLRTGAPPLALVESVAVETLEPASSPEPRFDIAPSSDAVRGTTSIPPDVATCDACLAELRDPADRRHGYPFIACTHCGPRYTMTVALPYDRATTTMAAFELCPPCRAEYEDPTSRRFHAQPTACPRCGPRLSMPVDEIVDALADGRVLALKGIGGYHLVCDARDRVVVDRLRTRKGRGAKPFAVMVRDLEAARGIAVVTPEAERLLTSPARPLVVLDTLDPALADSLAPGTGTLAVMLPYTPVHHLAFDAGAPAVLVMTSGNLSDEPICIDETEALERLGGIADVFCHHDRRIHVACDDSVVRSLPGSLLPVRRSRGYAPSPVALPAPSPPCLAVGGELKATLAVASGRRTWLSQHIGDIATLETLAMLERTAGTLAALHRVVPEVVVSDAHPDYLSRGWARRYASGPGIPHLLVQHHHAHLAALLAEHGLTGRDQPVLGVVFDGAGYGDDGTVWGGELLLGGCAGVERVGHLRATPMPGGDAATRHPARMALAHLALAGVEGAALAGTASAGALAPTERAVVLRMVGSPRLSVPTTSVGRLFDAVSSLLGVCHVADYEGQAAVELEAMARAGGTGAGTWPVRVTDGAEGVVIDPSPWVERAAVAGARGETSRSAAAWSFHDALSRAVTETAVALSGRHGVDTVGLTGGVFANALLTHMCAARLRDAGLTVLTHRIVPPNDGGLALGQVVVAAAGGGRPTSESLAKE